MTWDAVDLENRIAKIEWTIVWDQYTWLPKVKKRPKNGNIRYLVMPEILVQDLKAFRKKRDPKIPFIFHKKGNPYNRQSVAKAYHRVLTRMGRTDIKGTHWVRKTSATLANQITGDFYAVSRLLDHSSPDVTLKYVTPTNCEKQKVAEALNSVVSGFLKENARGENGHEDHDTPPAVPLRSLRGISQNLKLVKSTL